MSRLFFDDLADDLRDATFRAAYQVHLADAYTPGSAGTARAIRRTPPQGDPMPEPVELLDQLDAAWAEPERTCQWCMARPGEWCEHDCANPERHCHPAYVAQFAADRGAYADRDAALIVAAVNHLPALTSALRAVQGVIDEMDGWRENARQFGLAHPEESRIARARELAYRRAIDSLDRALSSLAHPTNQEGATR